MEEKKLNKMQLQTESLSKVDEVEKNTSMNNAKAKKNDEFYTRIEDIENEVKYYRKHFKNKVVLLNCDDPEWSNFYRYFYDQFNFLNLKKLIATHYSNGNKTYKIETTLKGTKLVEKKEMLEGDGDFRSDECIALLKEADIVVTNPPFSLFREYFDILIENKKHFLIMGDSKGISYKNVFPKIKSASVWLGVTKLGHSYYSPIDGIEIDFNDPKTFVEKKLGFTCWYTNIGKKHKVEHFALWEKYKGNEDNFLMCDNYDALFVNKAKQLPYDYSGLVAMPVTSFKKLGIEQFEIVGEMGTCQETFDKYNNGNMYLKYDKKNGKLSKKLSSNKNPLIPVDKSLANMYCPKRDMYFKRVYARILVKNKKVGIEGEYE